MSVTATTQPNLFQLHGAHLHVSYATSGIDGKPHFTYQDSMRSLSFSGDEIEVEKTQIGLAVTVRLVVTPDAGTTTFTLLAPTVNLDQTNHASIRTVGITTIHRSSIAPGLLHGQIELYTVTKLKGTAQRVAF